MDTTGVDGLTDLNFISVLTWVAVIIRHNFMCCLSNKYAVLH